MDRPPYHIRLATSACRQWTEVLGFWRMLMSADKINCDIERKRWDVIILQSTWAAIQNRLPYDRHI
jgi:hypothetical protein